jgi:hypothetical protein
MKLLQIRNGYMERIAILNLVSNRRAQKMGLSEYNKGESISSDSPSDSMMFTISVFLRVEFNTDTTHLSVLLRVPNILSPNYQKK